MSKNLCFCGNPTVQELKDSVTGEVEELCNSCYKKKLQEIRDNIPEPEKKKSTPKKCSFCENTENLKKVQYVFCEQCLETRCNLCGRELASTEKECIPDTRDGLKRCVDCYEKWLKQYKESLVKKYDFQIRNQYCSSCGQINDSRHEDGTVGSKFCSRCRQISGDMLDVEARRPKTSPEKDKMAFDPVVGIKSTKE